MTRSAQVVRQAFPLTDHTIVLVEPAGMSPKHGRCLRKGREIGSQARASAGAGHRPKVDTLASKGRGLAHNLSKIGYVLVST